MDGVRYSIETCRRIEEMCRGWTVEEIREYVLQLASTLLSDCVIRHRESLESYGLQDIQYSDDTYTALLMCVYNKTSIFVEEKVWEQYDVVLAQDSILSLDVVFPINVRECSPWALLQWELTLYLRTLEGAPESESEKQVSVLSLSADNLTEPSTTLSLTLNQHTPMSLSGDLFDTSGWF